MGSCIDPFSGAFLTWQPALLSAARETDVQHVPRLNQPRQSDADRTGSSDQSDADPTSPAKRSNSPRAGTPQRSSHLSIPATVASSHTGSIDEVASPCVLPKVCPSRLCPLRLSAQRGKRGERGESRFCQVSIH